MNIFGIIIKCLYLLENSKWTFQYYYDFDKGLGGNN